MEKDINDVLKYLYEQKQDKLAQAVIREISKKPTVINNPSYPYYPNVLPTYPNPLRPNVTYC